MNNFKKLTNCRACGSKDLKAYLELPDSPLCNNLLDAPGDSEKYPVQVLICEKCFLSQLSIVVSPEILYSNYKYHSSISNTFKNHCKQMVIHLKNNFNYKNEPPTVIDIAANDGCLLREFRDEGFIVRGFEPCEELAKSSWNPEKKEFILVIPKFFNLENSKNQRSWSGEDFITATNVFGHVDDLKDFLAAVKYQLESNNKGVFVVEVPHLLNLIKNHLFDTIYHEHLSYFLLRPLLRLFKDAGLPIFKVEKYNVHGGTIRIYAGNPGFHEIDISVGELVYEEESEGMYEISTYYDFATRVYGIGQKLQALLSGLEGKKIMGFGASAKGISLINYLGIGKYFHSIVDETPSKQGKFTPGYNIPIVAFSHFEKEKPDRIFIFASNFLWEMVEKTAHIECEYIIPTALQPDGKEVVRA